jgi:serine/threonine-protein kinase
MSNEAASPERVPGYSLVEQIGQGPACTVWRCRPDLGGADLALKRLEARYRDDPAMAERFEAEARLSLSLRHPHVVRVYEVVGRDASALPFFVMDLLPGGSVARFRGADDERLPEALGALALVCDALDYIHRRGLVHCDVKPSNVLLDGEGRPYLTDFGMAASPERLAREGTAGGTVAYMAPEQLESLAVRGPASRPLDGRADVYAVGVLLYEVLTGGQPFRASNRFSLLYKRSKATPREPSSLRPGLPAGLDALTLRALAADPAARVGGAAEMAAALRGI